MALAIVLTPGKVFAPGEAANNAKLNQLGQPVLTLEGTVSPDELASGDYSASLAAGPYFYGVDTGVANQAAVTLDPAPAQYVDGLGVAVKILAGNTLPATLNVNGLGAQSVLKLGNQPLDPGDWIAGQIVLFRYRLDGNSVPAAAAYSGGGAYVLAVTPGVNYTWTKGLLDTNLVNGVTTLVATGTFIATGTTVTLNGTASATVTATVVPDSNVWQMLSPVARKPVGYPFQRSFPHSIGAPGLVPEPPATATTLYLDSTGKWSDAIGLAIANASAAIASNNALVEVFKYQNFI